MPRIPDPIDFPLWDTAFAALYRRLAPAFACLESRLRVHDYLQALLGQLDRKNAWTLAEQMGERGPRACNVSSMGRPGMWTTCAISSKRM